MKKLLIFGALILLSISASFAQGEVRLGAKAGVNLASIGGDGDSFEGLGGYGNRTSFHIGGLVEVPITDKISIQPEVLYSAQGSSLDFGFGLGSDDYDIKLDYINIPVMGKYHIIEGLSAELGPVIGILIKAEGSDGNGGDADIKEFYKSTDISIGIGATYRFPMGVFASLRYNKGVSDINDDSDNSDKNQNNVFQVSGGFSF